VVAERTILPTVEQMVQLGDLAEGAVEEAQVVQVRQDKAMPAAGQLTVHHIQVAVVVAQGQQVQAVLGLKLAQAV
jgi:hypothetical protein